ncbi:MAG: hypothetical protein JWP11_1322 [Frankiales bacterium]|nr:hypothetical protein [Frankiales bacterium]
MTTTTAGVSPLLPTGDSELYSVLVALAPLGDRALQHVDISRREIDVDRLLGKGWSSGERCLVELALALWSGCTDGFDFTYFAISLGGEFFQAGIDAIAIRRGLGNFSTDGVRALDAALAP